MKKYASDIIAVVAAGIIIGGLSWMLHRDFTARLSAGDLKQIGTVTFKKKSALRKYSGRAIWEELDQQALVFNRDSVRTQSGAEAVVHLDDGTDIAMEENSLIMFSQRDQGLDINFEQGSISARRSGTEGSGAVSIISADTTVSISASDVSMTRSKDAGTGITVHSGNATVSTASGTQALGTDTALLIGAGGGTERIQRSLRAVSPQEGTIAMTREATHRQIFSFTPVDPGIPAFLELSVRRDFAAIASVSPWKENTPVSLAPGSWFWRIRTGAGATMQLSDVRRITIVRDTPVALHYPVNNQSIPASGDGAMVNFRWSANPYVATYRLEVARDPGFSSIVRSETITQNSLALGGMRTGSYHWRIVSTYRLAGRDETLTSPAGAFTLAAVSAASPPVLLYPKDGSRLPVDPKGHITLSWEARPGTASWRIIVSGNQDFTAPVLDRTTSGNVVQFPAALAGSYYWRVMDAAAQTASVSSWQFALVSVAPPVISGPDNGAAVEIPAGVAASSQTFRWNAKPGATYQFEVASDKNFLGVKHRVVSTSGTASVPLGAGTWYWRVMEIDESRNVLSRSATQTYVMTAKPRTGTPATAANTAESGEQTTAPQTQLVITADVRNAIIKINGVEAGKGRVSVQAKPGERYLVEISAKGYQDYREYHAAESGPTSAVQIALKRETESRIRWAYPAGREQLIQPILSGNVIISSAANRYLYASDERGGTRWRVRLDAILKGTPLVTEDRIYLVDTAGNFMALSLDDGTVLFKEKVEGPLLFGSAPITAGTMIYFATSYGQLYAYSREGKLDYVKTMEGAVYSTPAYYEPDDLLLIGTDQASLLGVSRKRGSRKWRIDTDDRIILASPIIWEKTVIVPTRAGSVTAYNLKNRKELWKFTASGAIAGTPRIHERRLIVGDESGTVYAIDPENGTEVWRRRLVGETTTPAIENDTLFITAGNSLYSLEAASGAIRWQLPFDSAARVPVSASGNRIYVGLRNGSLLSVKDDIYRE